MKKKIIIATTIPRSLTAFCSEMLRELSDKYEVVALSSPMPDLEKVKEREGIRTIAIPMERRISIIKDWKSLKMVIKVFKEEKPYMVHSMTPKAGLVCMMASRFTGVPIRVHTFTGLVWPTATGLKRRIIKFTDWLTCICATHIIPEGQGVLNDLKDGGITKKPMKVLGFGNVRGVDMSYYNRTSDVMERAQILRDESKFTFIFVGRIVKDKGISELIQAFERLKAHNKSIRLFLVGKYESQIDPIDEEDLKSIESDKDIVTTGPIYDKELLSYYAASDCFVFPSYREGFPNTVLEAGALGLPSIVTDINGSREIIVNGENGVIIPPKDVDNLYTAMKKMMEDANARTYMAGNARRMINERYEQRFVRNCLYQFYDEIIK